MTNRIARIRPTSTFDSFVPQNEQQEEVRDGLRRLANAVRDKIMEGGTLDHAKLVNLHGGAGRGKTHLQEAFLNVVRAGTKNQNDLYLLDGTSLSTWKYGSLDDVKVLAIDDLFQDYNSLRTVSRYDVELIMGGLFRSYEQRMFVFTTSNFPTNDVVEMIQQQDPIGRISSRLREMSIGAIELTGSDYREKLAEARKLRDPFSL